jgi:5-methyltetrahydrofolate--homocysteine methyltransferase
MIQSADLEELAKERVLILDGAMGTMIQKLSLEDADVTCDAVGPVFGCNEVLNLTRGDLICDIHMAYLRSGADIIETNTFGANAFSLAEYGLVEYVYDINLAAVEIARAAIQTVREETETPAFVAGVIGPTGKSISLSPSVDDPSYRDVTFDDFVAMYRQQIAALLDGHVDLLLIETVFDTLVAKAALTAALQLFDERSEQVPIMVSATFSDTSLRTLSGQTLEAFVASLSPYPLFSLGVNCSMGAQQMVPLIRKLHEISPFRTSAHPNAGFPDQEGLYRQTPEDFAQLLKEELEQGHLNIIGGCCGTTEKHIASLAEIAVASPPRAVQQQSQALQASGLEILQHNHNLSFIAIGERANVAGSRKFARLIRQRKFDEALAIARDQIARGASIIDICMDDPLIDPVEAMVTFLRLAGADPEIARVPFMIDSSQWEVIEAALKEIQGRALVNSISLKEGEKIFLERARHIVRMGGGIVVMLFDEHGQADTFARRCAVADRAYHLLIDTKTCREQDIIFDPNVLAIATGIDEHDQYAIDFIRSVSWIRSHCPGVSISGGISNLSFSFRGNTELREAIHAIFLEYASDAGLNMALVNPGSLVDPASVSEPAGSLIRHCLLADTDDVVSAREQLINFAAEHTAVGTVKQTESTPESSLWRGLPAAKRIAHALLIGDESYLAQDLQELETTAAVDIIEGPLMDGMKEVGRRFGEGKLFLPQVVRSARVMKRAVDILRPRLEITSGSDTSIGTILLATVKGDVHDIGKNIVSLVLSCNNFTVIDLGVMVPPQDILQAVEKYHPIIVGLSGLITPSLHEMAQVCRLFEEAGITIPIMIGGATTSEEHTALKLAPLYEQRVFHSTDASHAVSVARALLSVDQSQYIQNIEARYETIRHAHQQKQEKPLMHMDEAVRRRFIKTEAAVSPSEYGVRVIEDLPLEVLIDRINWAMVASAWSVPVSSEEANRLKADGHALLNRPVVRQAFSQSMRAVIGLFPARKVSTESIEVQYESRTHRFDFLRMQIPGNDGFCRSLADYVHDQAPDVMGMFAATAGIGMDVLMDQYRADHDDYHALLLGILTDRLVEALSGYLEEYLRHTWWNFGHQRVIRPAVGYPSAPDHAQKHQIFDLLQVEQRIGITLTEGYAMAPPSSVCGFYFVGSGCTYFTLGPLGEDQIVRYAEHNGLEVSQLEQRMQYHLGTASHV